MSKTILITGGCGFVGHHFVEHFLKETDWNIIIFDKLTYASSGLDRVRDIDAFDSNRVFFYSTDISQEISLGVIKELENSVNYIAHLAAESVSENTIIPTYRRGRNVQHLKIKNLWELYEKKYNKYSNERGVEIIDIFDPQEKALTIKSGYGQWRRIKQITRHWYEGKMINMRQKWGEITVTPNHSIYNSNMELTVPDKNQELLPLRKIKPFRNQLDVIEYFGNFKWKTSMDDLIYLIAFFVTEGSTTFNKANGNYIVEFPQNNIEDVYRIYNIIKDNFGTEGYICKRKCSSLRLNSKEMYNFFRNFFGTHSGNKKLPEFVFKLNDNLKIKLWEYMVYFDGTKYDQKKSKYCSNSEILISQICTLLSMVNIDYSYNRKVFDNEDWNDSFTINQCYIHNNSKDFSKYEEFYYKGWVYDIEVDDTHKFACGLGNIIVHNSHVDNSIENPLPFIKSNVIGTHNMLWFARKLNNLDAFCYFSCYDENTRALTKEGFKKFDEIKEGDKVLSLNKDTGAFEEREVKNIIIQDYEGEMINFSSQRVDLKVTPNHRIYYTKGNKEEIFVDEAQNLFGKTNIKLPNGKWKETESADVEIEGIGKVDINDLFYLSGLFISDGFLAYQQKKVESKSGLSKEERINKCRDSKTGKFISTSKIGENDYVTMNSWRIFFDVPENDKARKRLESTLERMGINYSSQKNKSGEHIYFSSKEWSEYFEQFGKYAKNKNIPSWMMNYSKDILKNLFEGLIDGDGYYGKGYIQYTTISEKLVSDMCELGFKLGYYPNFRNTYNTSYFEGRKISGHSYYIYFPVRTPRICKETQSKSYYKGKIWCLTVENNKNFIVERNGKLAISGNTDEVFGPAPDNVYFKEWDRYNCTNPYSATKAGGEELALAYANTYKLPTFITHGMNIFGERQHPEKYIPMCIRKIRDKEKIYIHSDATKTISGSRHWIHARNVAQGIHFLLDKFEQRDKYNIAGTEVTNLQLAQMIANIMGKDLYYELIDFHSSRPGHDLRYSLDNSKMKEIGWEPPLDLYDSLENMVNWTLQTEKWLEI